VDAAAVIFSPPPAVVARFQVQKCRTSLTRKQVFPNPRNAPLIRLTIETFRAAQIDGTEDKDVTITLVADERKFTGLELLQSFILPNFYFHCTTAYFAETWARTVVLSML
jgi:hypothetical protein